MSHLEFAIPKQGRRTAKELFMLERPDQYASWMDDLKDAVYQFTAFPDFTEKTAFDTIDQVYFKAHEDFKVDFKANMKDDAGKACDPFIYNKDFATKCLSHALTTGGGMLQWTTTTYHIARAALSRTIKSQTGMVRRGDIKGLLQAIRLAINQLEVFNPEALEIAYVSCTMDGERGYDLMTYLSALASYIRRLEAVGLPPTEKKKMRVLLSGLDQTIFQSFIFAVNRAPYDDYQTLEFEIQKAAAIPFTNAALKALKPGQALANVTHASVDQGTVDDRMNRIEHLLVTMQLNPGSRDRGGAGASGGGGVRQRPGYCWSLRDKGMCPRGDKCRFSHAQADKPSEKPKGNRPGNGRDDAKVCILHGKGHETESCVHLSNNPGLKATLQAGITAQGGGRQVNATTANEDDGYSFVCTTHASGLENQGLPYTASIPEYMLSTRGVSTKIDRWCVDGASTIMATWDKKRCFNIRSCEVVIHGSNAARDAGSMVCREVGDTLVPIYDSRTGKSSRAKFTNVLINEAFPFHIFSEVLAYERWVRAS